MKKLLFLLLLFFNLAWSDDYYQSADEITYESLLKLAELTAYTDHIPVFKELFAQMKVKTFLEFGVGYSTKYFLDSCTKVISVEFVTHGYGPEWIKNCLDLFRPCAHWLPIVFFSGCKSNPDWAPYKYNGSEHVYKAASYQSATHKNYALIDDFYLTELNAFIMNLTKCHKIDVAFVDPGIYLRGDLVQLLFDKVPIILAHDTRCRHEGMQGDVYGYSRIVTPENYEELFANTGQGVSIWVRKQEKYQALIKKLKELSL